VTATLKTDLNLADPDGVYEALIELHRGLTPEQSKLLNAKLILLLINQVGDRAVIDAAFAKARAGFSTPNI
jgi:Protein of unknown function (DUF2783)